MATTPTFGWPTPDDTDLVRDGAAAIRALGDAVDAYSNGGYLFAGIIEYTGSANFVKADPFGTGDIGVRAVRIICVGGGGAGGRAIQNNVGGGGGGAGGTRVAFVTDMSELDASEGVVRGAGSTSTSPGGSSTFGGTKVVGEGGASGGRADTAGQPGGGGAGGGGSATIGEGYRIAGGCGQNGSTIGSGGGGSSHYGGGGRPHRLASGGADGVAAPGIGGGGGGAQRVNVNGNDGNGANGRVFVEVYV